MSGSEARGKLKVFLGFAAGVGKTYQMLEEAQELRQSAVDVAIGYFEPHARKETIALTTGLELIPRRRVDYRGVVLEEMDTEAVLTRHPAVCVVDEFPHTNAPGSLRKKRWEDVLVMLENGIDVLTTMNIQHLESLNDQVYQISGVRVRETVPDWVMESANEVVMVDLTPRALLNRLERGVVYSPEKAKEAMSNFFREPTLAALREMALRQTAHEVEMRHGETVHEGPAIPRNGARSDERILAIVTASPSSIALIRRAKRVADFILADCIALGVTKTGERTGNEREQARWADLQAHLNFARNLHVDARMLPGKARPEAIAQFARANGVTQIFLAWPGRERWLPPFIRNDVQRLVSLARDMQVAIVDDRRETGDRNRKNGI